VGVQGPKKKNAGSACAGPVQDTGCGGALVQFDGLARRYGTSCG
jgi:hypothetical protein